MCWFECLDWKSWTKTVLADVDRADQKLDFNEIQRNLFCPVTRLLWSGLWCQFKSVYLDSYILLYPYVHCCAKVLSHPSFLSVVLPRSQPFFFWFLKWSWANSPGVLKTFQSFSLSCFFTYFQSSSCTLTIFREIVCLKSQYSGLGLGCWVIVCFCCQWLIVNRSWACRLHL